MSGASCLLLIASFGNKVFNMFFHIHAWCFICDVWNAWVLTGSTPSPPSSLRVVRFLTCLLASSNVSVLKNHGRSFKLFMTKTPKFQNVYFHSILSVRWVMRPPIQIQEGKEEYSLSIIRGMAWRVHREEIGEHHGDKLPQAWKRVHRKTSSRPW